MNIQSTRSVRKVSDRIFLCEHLMDYNLARLHEPTLNLSAHAWIFSRLSIASVAGKQHLSEVVCSARVDFSLQGKWRNDWSSATASNFARNWATARWKPFGRFTRFSVTMLWASRRLRSGTTGLKTAAHRWRASHAPVGHQHAEMTRSLPKWTLWWCGTVVWLSEKLRKRWA